MYENDIMKPLFYMLALKKKKTVGSQAKETWVLSESQEAIVGVRARVDYDQSSVFRRLISQELDRGRL